MTHPQPHRSEPDQGDSRARFEPGSVAWWLDAALNCPQFAWDPDQHECATLALASEQRSAGAVGEPVAWRIDYPIDNSIGQTRFFGHREQMTRAIQWNPGAVAVPLYAAPTASGDARDAERLDWLEANPRRVQASIGYGGAKDAWTWKDTDHNFHVADTLRAAINAARGNHD